MDNFPKPIDEKTHILVIFFIDEQGRAVLNQYYLGTRLYLYNQLKVRFPDNIQELKNSILKGPYNRNYFIDKFTINFIPFDISFDLDLSKVRRSTKELYTLPYNMIAPGQNQDPNNVEEDPAASLEGGGRSQRRKTRRVKKRSKSSHYSLSHRR